MSAILRGVQNGRFITFRIGILCFNHNATKYYRKQKSSSGLIYLLMHKV